MDTSVPSKVFELGPILPNLSKIRRVLAPNHFVLYLTKPVQPIFQSAGPTLGHAALEGTLMDISQCHMR